MTTEQALETVAAKERRAEWPVSREEIAYRRAKAEFDMLDALSRTRALTHAESRAMERAMKRMDEWSVAA